MPPWELRTEQSAWPFCKQCCEALSSSFYSLSQGAVPRPSMPFFCFFRFPPSKLKPTIISSGPLFSNQVDCVPLHQSGLCNLTVSYQTLGLVSLPNSSNTKEGQGYTRRDNDILRGPITCSQPIGIFWGWPGSKMRPVFSSQHLSPRLTSPPPKQDAGL